MSSNLYQANAPLPPAKTVDEGTEAKRAPTYEPHCLMAWAEQCAGMDDMGGINHQPQEKT